MPADTARLHAVFDLAMRVGEGLLANGAAASEATATILRITSASGLRNVSVQVTFAEITISYLADETSAPFTRVRSASERVQNFAQLAAYEDIAHGYILGRLDLPAARSRAETISKQKPVYRQSLVIAGNGVLGGAAALGFGGGPLVVIAATITACIVIAAAGLFARWSIPAFYAQVFGGFFAVFVAVVVGFVDPTVNPSIVVVTAIIVLLMGLASTSAVQDAVTGWYVTAAGRILETLMLTIGIVVGVRAGILVAQMIEADISVSAALPVSLISVLVVVVSGLGTGFGLAIVTQVPVRHLVWAALITATASVVVHLLDAVLPERAYAVALTAFVVGAVATVLGDVLRAPALMFATTGIIPLVPGSRIYRGLLGLGEDMAIGVAELLAAAEIAVGIATGVVLGQLLASRAFPLLGRRGIAYTPSISAPFTTMRRRRLTLGSRGRARRRQGVIEPSTMTGEMSALTPAMLEGYEDILEPAPPRDRGADRPGHR